MMLTIEHILRDTDWHHALLLQRMVACTTVYTDPSPEAPVLLRSMQLHTLSSSAEMQCSVGCTSCSKSADFALELMFAHAMCAC